MRMTKAWMLAALAAAALAACGGGGGGGGGGDDDGVVAASAPQGVFSGTLSGSTSSQFQLLMLENGEYWTMYGNPSGSQFLVRGFVQGSGTATTTDLGPQKTVQFTSDNVRDFGVSPAASGTLRATASDKGIVGASPDDTLSGSVTAGGAKVTFSGTRSTSGTYDYDAAADLSLITGNWSMTALDGSAVNISVASNGAFTGSTDGCTISGTLSPRPSGKNVFDVGLDFGGAPCTRPGTSASGIAITYAVGAQRELLMAGTNTARTEGTAAFGLR